MPLKRLRVQNARDAAISKFNNPRNYEYVWYIFWNQVMTRVAELIDPYGCYVAPQLPLWRLYIKGLKIKISPEIDMEADGGSSDEEVMMEEEEEGVIGDEDDEDMVGDTSISSVGSGSTTKLKNRKRITDFALVLWGEIGKERVVREGGVENIRDEVLFESNDDASKSKFFEEICLLLEVKRFPSRKLIGKQVTFTGKLDDLMIKAREDVLLQATYLFMCTRWRNQNSVMAIAAVGDHWSYAVVDREQVVPIEREQEAKDWEPSYSLVANVIHSDWSPVERYGSKESAKAEKLVVLWIQNRFYHHEIPKRR